MFSSWALFATKTAISCGGEMTGWMGVCCVLWSGTQAASRCISQSRRDYEPPVYGKHSSSMLQNIRQQQREGGFCGLVQGFFEIHLEGRACYGFVHEWAWDGKAIVRGDSNTSGLFQLAGGGEGEYDVCPSKGLGIWQSGQRWSKTKSKRQNWPQINQGFRLAGMEPHRIAF